MSKKLIFIYNANNDPGSKLLDFTHKIISPTTYNCALCSLTYGHFLEKKEWKVFKKRLVSKGFELLFLHKDEFKKKYKSKFGYAFNFPIVLTETEYDLEVFITTNELNSIERLGELWSMIEKRQ